MENKSLSCEISRDDVVYTLMKVSQLDSTSSSSLGQSTPSINKTIGCEKLRTSIINTKTQCQTLPDKCPINPTINIKINLPKKINEKLFQFQWNNYVHWKTLLSFGFGLWIALCIADKHYRRDYSSLEMKKYSKIIETTIDANIEEKMAEKNVNDSHCNWFYNLFSNMSSTNGLLSTPEACMLSLLIVIIIFIEFRLRIRNANNTSQISCTQCCHDFPREKSLDDKYYRDKSRIEKLKNEERRNIYDELGPVFSSENRSHTIGIIPYDGLHINSDVFWQLGIVDSCDHHKVTDNIKRNHNKHFNKLGIKSNVAKNIDRSQWNDNNNFYDTVKLNSQNVCTDNNCSCSLQSCTYNNPGESINVNSSYDKEIDKYIMSECNTSTTAFEETTNDWLKYKNNNIERRKIPNSHTKGDELLSINTIKSTKNNNNCIISSSPVFKKFLLELKNNPTAFKTQS